MNEITEQRLHSRPNVSTLRSSVFIRGGLNGGLYSIPCGDCEKVYLGQTKRQFCTRLKEHQRAVSNFNSSKSALAEHVCETSHNIAWEDSRIITTNNRYGQRLCLEAWHINASPCALNRDDGSHLPQEYLHLVGR